MYNPYKYRKTIPSNTRNRSNLCEYRKMVESGRVPGKGRVPTSIEKLSQRIQEMGRIYVSTDKMVESGQVRGTGRIPASIEKLSRRVPKKGRIYVSTDKMVEFGQVPGTGRIPASIENCPGEYRKRVESV